MREQEYKEVEYIVAKDIELILLKWKKLELPTILCLLISLQEICMYIKHAELTLDIGVSLKEILDLALMKVEKAYKNTKGKDE